MAESELQNLIENFHPNVKDPFYSLLYLPEDFTHRESAQRIEIQYGIMGCKDTYPTLLHFWLHSLDSFLEDIYADSSYFSSVATQSMCQAVSQDEIFSVARACLKGLKQPPKLEYQGNFIRGLKMCDDWNFKAYVGETDQHYFAFYWETTA